MLEVNKWIEFTINETIVNTSCKRSLACCVRMLLNASKSNHVKICYHNCFLTIKLV